MTQHIKLSITPEMIDSRANTKLSADESHILIVSGDSVELSQVGDRFYLYVTAKAFEKSYMLTPQAYIQIHNKLLGIPTNEQPNLTSE